MHEQRSCIELLSVLKVPTRSSLPACHGPHGLPCAHLAFLQEGTYRNVSALRTGAVAEVGRGIACDG